MARWKTECSIITCSQRRRYQENWDNVQLSIFDPSVTGNLVFTTNGPITVRGAETQLLWRVAGGLTVTGSAHGTAARREELTLIAPTDSRSPTS